MTVAEAAAGSAADQRRGHAGARRMGWVPRAAQEIADAGTFRGSSGYRTSTDCLPIIRVAQPRKKSRLPPRPASGVAEGP